MLLVIGCTKLIHFFPSVRYPGVFTEDGWQRPVERAPFIGLGLLLLVVSVGTIVDGPEEPGLEQDEARDVVEHAVRDLESRRAPAYEGTSFRSWVSEAVSGAGDPEHAVPWKVRRAARDRVLLPTGPEYGPVEAYEVVTDAPDDPDEDRFCVVVTPTDVEPVEPTEEERAAGAKSHLTYWLLVTMRDGYC